MVVEKWSDFWTLECKHFTVPQCISAVASRMHSHKLSSNCWWGAHHQHVYNICARIYLRRTVSIKICWAHISTKQHVQALPHSSTDRAFPITFAQTRTKWELLNAATLKQTLNIFPKLSHLVLASLPNCSESGTSSYANVNTIHHWMHYKGVASKRSTSGKLLPI